MEGRKSKPAKKRLATKKPSVHTAKAKPAVKKQVVRRIQNKKKSTRKVAPIKRVIEPVRSVSIPTPLVVQPLATSKLKSKHSRRQWPLHHYFITVGVLAFVGALAMTTVADFAQLTFMQIDSLTTTNSTLLKPTPIETRFFATTAGELTLALPATWTATTESENTITYTHNTLASTTISIAVATNDSDNIFTWLQNNQPDYTNATVIEASPAVDALRGVMVTATTTDRIPLQIIYLPIQKNLGERYVVSIRAQLPTEESTIEVKRALESLLESFGVK
ncbi:MAG: hypothetical protein HY565_05940 [Candidatus Kerfeldbacteria bacterium]|nr:hypothetical protein [Candidatus Kerfeldbacteria bacterium]